MTTPQLIKDLVTVRNHPTVIRLEHLQQGDASWISHSYYITPEIKNHLQSLKTTLQNNHGCGLFLIGHYGSGKSHFLAYIAQQIQSNQWLSEQPEFCAISLINYRAENSLEDIVCENLKLQQHPDRRDIFSQLNQRCPSGLFLILDELSEFLRSKKNASNFNEDVRFLQFLGEWSQHNKFWILAAMQEQIEHTGELEYALYRKIKDRYPLRLLLTTVHVRNLISDSVLIKAPDYQIQVAQLTQQLQQAFPQAPLDAELLNQIYPLHPMTIELLEEVRDRFSQSRGIIEFTVNQLNGNTQKQLSGFIEQPWGSLLTPDYIVDHFADLFEIQPEFLPIAQQLFPYYRKQISQLLKTEKLQQLAWKLLKLLILVYITPGRQQLSASQAAYWLLFKVTRIDPDKNLHIVKKVLNTLADDGRFVIQQNNEFKLDFKDDGFDDLEQHLKREIKDIQNRGEVVFEILAPLLKNVKFSPWFTSRENWQFRQFIWHFHERKMALYLGDNEPVDIKQSDVVFCIRLPWGEQAIIPHCAMIIPEKIQLTTEIIELAAMQLISERPLRQPAKQRLLQQINSRQHFFEVAIRTSYANAQLLTMQGEAISNIKFDVSKSFEYYIELTGRWLLQHNFPAFERFAPSYGPLPKEAYRSFMKQAIHHDVLGETSDNYVKLIREAYLIPLGLLRRQGRDYLATKSLGRHDLVSLVLNLLDQQPAPKVIYQHLTAPIYGLVPDQIHCLLYFLFIMGDIDIIKGTQSLRDHFETLTHPWSYDKIIAGHALTTEQVNSLTQLADFLKIRIPKQWTVVAQKQTINQVKSKSVQSKQKLQTLLLKLNEIEQADGLTEKVQQVIANWNALHQSSNEIYAFQQFLYEISSTRQFIHLLDEVSALPDKIENILREHQRFQHLLTQFQSLENIEIVDEFLSELTDAPPLNQPDELANWLSLVKSGYLRYQISYKRSHDLWWQQQKDHAILNWQPASVSLSEHIGLKTSVMQFNQLQQQARQKLCQQISPLEYQVICRCAYNGKNSPIEALFEKLNQLKNDIEKNLNHFFSQQKVKEQVKQYVNEQIESNPQTQLYLQGEKQLPKLTNIEQFDQRLIGIEMTKTLDCSELFELITEQIWQPERLIDTFSQWITQQLGQCKQIKFNKVQITDSKDTLLAWTAQQCLNFAQPLPSSMSQQQHQAMAKIILPEWLSQTTIENIEQLKLGHSSLLKILKWLDQGHLKLPKNGSNKGYIRQIQQMKCPPEIVTAEQLANEINDAYHCHIIMMQVNQSDWLAYLDQLNNLKISVSTANDILKQYKTAQWLIIDAMGISVYPLMISSMTDFFPDWQVDQMGFMQISSPSTTANFYQQLTDERHQHSFEKINCLDDKIHHSFLPYEDLMNVVKAELKFSIKQCLTKMEANQPLLIFADHGFRIDKSGKKYSHGGSTTIEQVTPYFYLRNDN
jgi:hypothetical protein